MQLICRDGDLALVVQDEDLGVANIGKLVRVKGPMNFNQQLRRVCWLIEPVKAEMWSWTTTAGVLKTGIVTFASNVEHPDAWLFPLRPEAQDDEFSTAQLVVIPDVVVCAT